MGFPAVKLFLKGKVCKPFEHDVDLKTKQFISWSGGGGNQYICLKCGRLIQELDEFVLVRVFENNDEEKMELIQEETVD